MKINTIFRSAVLFISLYYSLSAFSQTGATAEGQFSLQGKLTSTSGTPIVDGQHTLTINVYAQGSAQAVLTETDVVTTVDGIFSTMVGDNGDLEVNASTEYELGIAVDGQSELSPRIALSSALSALTADVALNADAVDGFSVSLPGSPTANSLVTLNANAKLDSSLLSGSLVTSVNGSTGPVTITGGGDLAVNTSGNTISLSFTGSGGGGLTLPFTQTLNLGSGTGFSLTNTLAGSAATFANTGLGAALNATANTGAAIVANSTGSLTGAATIEVSNTAGTAINAVANVAGDAALTVQNLSADASADIISAVNAGGTAVFDVAVNGQTTINATVDNALNVQTTTGTAINAVTDASADAALTLQNTSVNATAKLMTALNSAGTAVLDIAANGKTTLNATVADALEVSTSAVGETALKVTGGLEFIGAAGTGTITTGLTQITINNALVKANSIILLTVNGGGLAAVPLRIISQANGSFTAGVFAGVAALTGNVTFNYLIINQ